MSTWERLQQAFLADHQAMLRGFQDLIAALAREDWEAAVRAASRLDTVAGPHIEFEEKYLYPQVGRSRGDTYLSRLYDDHEEVAGALTEILDVLADPNEKTPSRATVARWMATLRGGIDHASACGTLLGELKGLPEERQREFLDGLTRLRDQAARWTELAFHVDTHAATT
jgi:hypothetical protein